MMPVDQTTFGGPDDANPGDCYRACIASVLELPIDQVPHFLTGDADRVHEQTNEWLKQFGLSLLTVTASKQFIGWIREFGITDGTYHLMGGAGPRGHRHCVVGRSLQIVHDPHPSRAGLESFDTLDLFVVRDPAKVLIPMRGSAA